MNFSNHAFLTLRKLGLILS